MAMNVSKDNLERVINRYTPLEIPHLAQYAFFRYVIAYASPIRGQVLIELRLLIFPSQSIYLKRIH